ncbi:MAG: ABC transporter permease [Opitutae bacterium]|nr:ABC transporter permease [Opitutae bacterium]
MLADLRFALRQLAKSPGFTAVAVLTLALAIGVNSAVFTLINAVVLRPLVPLRPAEIVNLFNGRQGAERNFRAFSNAEYLALREAKDTFADVAATSLTSAGLDQAEGIRRSRACFISEGYFSMLGVQPALGRFFNADECRPNANLPVVVASYATWQRAGGRADFVGSTLNVNGKSYTVIGVVPEGFEGLNILTTVDLWVPLGVFTTFSSAGGHDLSDPKAYDLLLTARLASGVSLKTFAGHRASLAQRLTALLPDSRAGARELHAEAPSRQGVSTYPSGGDSSVPMAIGLFSMSGCVLLIACLNLANMLLARGSSRAKEIALRLALGAARWRIIRQLLAEGLVLAGTGGVLGLLVGVWGNDLLVRSFTSLTSLHSESLVIDLQPDARVIAVTFLLCLVAILLFSLGPALKASRADLVHDLKQQSDESAAAGRAHHFFSLRHCLVMAQIALSLVLLFSAGLFLRGALKAGSVEPGFDTTGTLAFELDYSLVKLPPEAAQRSLLSALEHISSQPRVQSAAAATFVPYSFRNNGTSVRRVQEAIAEPGDAQANPALTATNTAITTGYFYTLGVRLIRGRDFTAAEVQDSTRRVAIIDEGLAKKLFPAGDALGQQIRVGSTAREIVGICAPHRHNTKRAVMPDRVFVPYASGEDGRAYLLVRYATTDAAATAAAITPLRVALRAFDPDLPVLLVKPFSQFVERDFGVWLARFGAILFGTFGAIALLLAVIGVYGVKAYAVAQRTREIGIRMAIGAQRRDVLALILKQGAWQVLVGVGLGWVLTFGAGKVLAKMLYQVNPTDALVLAASATVLALAALLACWLPARRATKVDPLVALRRD